MHEPWAGARNIDMQMAACQLQSACTQMPHPGTPNMRMRPPGLHRSKSAAKGAFSCCFHAVTDPPSTNAKEGWLPMFSLFSSSTFFFFLQSWQAGSEGHQERAWSAPAQSAAPSQHWAAASRDPQQASSSDAAGSLPWPAVQQPEGRQLPNAVPSAVQQRAAQYAGVQCI